MKKEIIAAIIAKSQQELEQRINKVKGIAKFMHLDVMDGKFVPTHSLDFNFKLPKARYEAHLMMYHPERWIKKNADKVDTIIFHTEETNNPEEIIKLIKNEQKKVGIALNPETHVERIKEKIKEIDKVIIMTVHPGKYGSKFLPQTLKKIKALRKSYPKLDIEVDGGINPDTIKKAHDAGANIFVVGSYLQNSGNPKEAVKKLKDIIK